MRVIVGWLTPDKESRSTIGEVNPLTGRVIVTTVASNAGTIMVGSAADVAPIDLVVETPVTGYDPPLVLPDKSVIVYAARL